MPVHKENKVQLLRERISSWFKLQCALLFAKTLVISKLLHEFASIKRPVAHIDDCKHAKDKEF